MQDRVHVLALKEKEQLEQNLRNHHKAIENINARIKNIDFFLEMYNRISSSELDDSIIDNKKITNNHNIDHHYDDNKKRNSGKNMSKEHISDICIDIIKQNNYPMSRLELYNALIERGINIIGLDPQKILSTMLWRMQEKIVHIHGYGYWPADISCPEANYYPVVKD